MHQKTFQTIQKHNLIPAHALVVVAVSGGADSLALLHILNELRPRLGCHLHVATLDHGLRGEAGAADVRFVADIATRWGLPVTVDRVDVPALMAQTGQGVEAAARQARFTFLAQVAHETGATVVATAHHANDQAETILLHLLRGTGLRGLGGMAFRTPLPGFPKITLIRPLLETSRDEIEAYCHEHGLSPRSDETNQDTTLRRNRIRHKILPQLETINPQIVSALIHLGESAAADLDYLAEQFNPVIASSNQERERITISRAYFVTLHPALQRRFVLWAAAQLGSEETISYDHLLAAVKMGSRGMVNGQVLLPGDLRLRVDYTMIAVERLAAGWPDSGYPLLPPGEAIPLVVPDTILLPGEAWKLMTATDLPAEAVPGRWVGLPASNNLALRTRRAGDRFAPPGLGGHTKKLNRWFTDHKVPSYLRDRIPLLTINDEIAAIALAEGWVVSTMFTTHGKTESSFYITNLEKT